MAVLYYFNGFTDHARTLGPHVGYDCFVEVDALYSIRGVSVSLIADSQVWYF
jgi:hypothetical protein